MKLSFQRFKKDLKLRFALVLCMVLASILGIFSTLVYFQLRTRLLAAAEMHLKSYMEHEWDHIKVQAPLGTLPVKQIYERVWKNGQQLFDTLPIKAGMPYGNNLVHIISRKLNGDQYLLEGYYDLFSTHEYLSALRKILILASILAVILVIPLSFLFTRAFLKPFRELSKKTSELGVEKLSYRFLAPSFLDEYGLLVSSFNSLLERLELSFRQLRVFATNASHELRTPLTIIRGEAEVMLRRPRTQEEYEASLRRVLSQVDTLQKITAYLLTLADIERVKQEKQTGEIAVKRVVQDVVRSLEFAYPGASKLVTIEQLPEIKIIGSVELFSSVLNNLVENALKYATDRVLLRYVLDKQVLRVEIEDDGPGIPLDKRDEVFEPFVKFVGTLSKPVKGHGIGLSIVKICMGVLRGEISLEDSALGGLKVKVSIPQFPT